MITEDDVMGEPQEILQRCLELFNEGRISEADVLAEAGLRRSPDDGDLWQMYGLPRQRRRRRRRGLCGAGDGRSARAAGLLIPLRLADCYARTGRIELARDLYRHLAGDNRCPTALLPAVASGLGAIGDDETALDVCRELVRRDPTRHEAHFGMAFYLRRLGNPPEAILPVVARAHSWSPRPRSTASPWPRCWPMPASTRKRTTCSGGSTRRRSAAGAACGG